ncbi:microtubule-associated protein MAP65-3-like, partial [Trifolium pratense]
RFNFITSPRPSTFLSHSRFSKWSFTKIGVNSKRKRFKRSESQRLRERDFPLWIRHCNPIENQGECNSCFAFAACCVLEVMLYERSNKRIRLSKQHLYNHLILAERFEDAGAFMPVTLDFVKQFGCVLERHCPYLNYWEKPRQHHGDTEFWCRPANTVGIVVKVDEWKELYFEHVFKYLREEGPVICAMEWKPVLEDLRKTIWDEVGEAELDRDRRKVDKANQRQAIAEWETELAAICSAMGERPVHIRQSDLLKKVQEHHLYTLNSLCSVLGFDFQQTVLGIHRSLGDIEGPTSVSNDTIQQAETTCGSLLYELQTIWDEIGEAEPDRDRMLFELEQQCLEVYRRKVDQANRSRAQLKQAIAHCEAELAGICSAMGERPVHIRQSDQNAGSLKEEHAQVLPYLEEMKKQKFERRNQFIEVQEQIENISIEIYGPKEYVPSIVDETDLSMRKLEELHRQLNALQSEKSDRLKNVQEHLYTLNSLCSVLGFDFMQTVLGIHPSLGDIEGPTSVSNDTIQQLAVATQQLREIKLQRMQKLQDLATTMLELWNLMDTPIKEQQMFQNVACNIAASEDEITEPNTL